MKQIFVEIIEELNWIEEEKIKNIRKEAKELLAIFTSIANKLKIKYLKLKRVTEIFKVNGVVFNHSKL